MAATVDPPVGAHLVGSVPLDDAELVMRATADVLGGYMRRLPDGETGERSNWIRFQHPRLAASPSLVQSQAEIEYSPFQRLQLAAGVDTVELGSLGYADAAVESYAVFSRLQREGVVPDHMRFLVGLPTPLAVTTMYVRLEDRPRFEPAYEAALAGELARILEAVPPDRLAIQWETVIEFALLEGLWEHHLPELRAGIAARLVRLAASVPDAVEMGFHLCYGDSGHKHFCEPADTTHLTWAANQVIAGVDRSLDWLHLPVPRSRDDVAYYEPLADLARSAETELYLGLVHHTDGVSGTERRIAAASQVVSDFGVATECGLGRRSPETIAELLALHAAVAQPLS